VVNKLKISNNALLSAFEELEDQPWMEKLEPIDLPLGTVLNEPRSAQSHLFFPGRAIVSLLCLTESGATAEVAAVGREGVVGITTLLGGGPATCSAVVQSAGMGWRIEEHVLRDEFSKAGAVMNVLLRYMQSLITQMTQTAVCNRHHSLERQLCRWLLQTLDRLPGNDMTMTQELIAKALGVRREGVTEGALKLQRAGLICYTRGHITVLDRDGLEKSACECYAVVSKECDRLRPVPLAG
jgi:CRP-like cAMP-binding protein